MNARFRADDLISLATTLLDRAGLEHDKSQVVSEMLVEGDLLGHTTHGLQLLAPYLNDLESGGMTKSGSPRVVADYPAAITWDGMRLPGPWLLRSAIELAIERAKKNGTCTFVIRRSHHTACLAAYLKRVTDQGLMIILSCTDSHFSLVAPHGGKRGVYAPNPIAAGWPTNGEPVLIDTSMSITSMGVLRRAHQEHQKLPGDWLMNNQGQPSNDPADLFTDPPGAMLPIGGMDHGHKGYALGLLVEALTAGLAGYGRTDPKEGWANTVYLQVCDPELYGGSEGFLRETSWIADACRKTPPREGFENVRMPGEAGLRKRKTQIENGVELHPAIMPALEPWMRKFNVTELKGL